MAVRERMEEVQRKTSAKTQATQSEGSRGQEPTTSCRRAPGQDCVSVRRSGGQELLLQVLSTKVVEVFTLPQEGIYYKWASVKMTLKFLFLWSTLF